MVTYFETRRRIGRNADLGIGDLYRVRSWYLFGFVLLFRRYEQLTTREPLPSEM